MDPSRPLSLKVLRLGLREEMERRGSSPPYRPSDGSMGLSGADLTVPGFGQVEDYPPIPGFGEEGSTSVRVQQEDLDRAADRLERYDTNHDGTMDREEAKRGRWSDDPFQYDKNHDGRLSKQEMAMRYAPRRVIEAGRENRPSSYSSRFQPGRSGQGSSSQDPRRDSEENDDRRRPSAAEREAWSLAESMMDRYDVNHNRALDRTEWRDLALRSATTDTDGNGLIDRRELAMWLLRRAAKSVQRVPEGLPDWFTRCDLDGDGQIVMAEFTEEWTEQKAVEFVQHDRNGDGVIVPEECLSGMNLPDGSYVNHQMQIIPAGATIHSEIIVPDDDDEPTADLDVQISITHTRVELLDAFLIGPQGERVELFTGVGGGDDHFANTIFDDEASWPIVRGRPPFSGRYRPEGALKDQPSLRQFYGRDITGTWTLMVCADRSDRPGALHGWSLIVTPEDDDRRPDEDWEDGSGRSMDGRYSRENEEPDWRFRGRPGDQDNRPYDRSGPPSPWWQRR